MHSSAETSRNPGFLGVLATLAVTAGWLCGCNSRHERVASQQLPTSTATPPTPALAVAPALTPRLISLTPSTTEVIAALGAADQLVGVDDYSNFPDEVRRLPKVGSYLSPNLEEIIKLRPTLVIVDDVHADVQAALTDAHITTLGVAMHALPDIKISLRSIGKALGRDQQANAEVEQIDAALDAAAAQRPPKRPRVLAVIDHEVGGLGNLVAAGPGSWLDELLAVVGGDNVLASAGVRYPKISVEEIIKAQPDVIIDVSFGASAEHADGTAAWNDLAVPAVRNHRVVIAKEQYLLAPSPRVEQALTALQHAIAIQAP